MVFKKHLFSMLKNIALLYIFVNRETLILFSPNSLMNRKFLKKALT